MYKYIITYRLNSDNKESYNERLTNLKTLSFIKWQDKTTSTLLGYSNLDISLICNQILVKCNLLMKDNIMVFKINKDKENEVFRIKNKKIISLKKMSKWISC